MDADDVALPNRLQVQGGQQYFSSRTNTIFQDVQKIAEKMEDEYISTEHILLALIERAREAGYTSLSLSVEPGNPARKLYERHGFRVVDEGADAWTMVAPLASNQGSD